MLGKDHTTSERSFAEALERYLGDTLHDGIPIMEFASARSLPSFLGRTYAFYEAWIA